MKTDAQIQKEVISELKSDHSVDAEQIGVAVNAGVVTLTADAKGYAEKWNAERAAQQASIVVGRNIACKLSLNGLHQRSDAEVARATESVLQWLINLPRGCITVVIKNGWITLTGQVDWKHQRQQAGSAARHLFGIEGVNNRIAIKSKLPLLAAPSNFVASSKQRALKPAKANPAKVRLGDARASSAGKWATESA